MLEIDYNLLPLSDEESAQIAHRARLLARRGKPPPITPASYGRVVVVNPYEGFTINHVPDDLRRPLRRAMVSTHVASKVQTGEQLAEQILEASDEPIFQIVIELHSNFPRVVSFLEQIPRIRRKHPHCRVMIHGNMLRVNDLLERVLDHAGSRCELMFDHMEEGVVLERAEDLEHLMLDLPKYPAFPRPFFSKLRIRAGGSAAEYNISSLRRLYTQFGVGHIDELDLSGKMKEKLIVLDIPVPAIEFIRFSPDRGDTFRGVRLSGEMVLAERFREAGLETRDIPFNMIDAFYRQLPGRGEDEINMKRVRALRVNCFDGHVSFLWKPSPSAIPLYEVRGIRMQLNVANGDGSEVLEDSGDGLRTVEIDTAVVTERGQPRFGDVRAGIREKYLQHIFNENLARHLKLQRYAAKLKVGCLGPMAAQAIKLMRPYGLGQVVPPESLYYLGDSYRQLPDYYKANERVERLFKNAVADLKKLFEVDEAAGVNHEVITHRLPLLNEWVRGEIPPLKEITSEQLDTIYKEIKIYLGFAETEYQRIDRSAEASQKFFDRLERCRAVSLQVRHLANLIGERYGQLPSRQSFPDFVFFGTDTDTQQNQAEFFLPGLGLASLFRQPGNQELFHTEDFEFGVFVEEQLSILSYVQRQEMQGGTPAEFQQQYFDERIAEAEKENAELEQNAHGEMQIPEGEAGQVMDRMAEKHKDETEGFRSDRDEEARKLQAQENDYFQSLKAVNAYLVEAGSIADLVGSGEDFVRALDNQLMQKSREFLDELKVLVRGNLREANALIKQKKDQLTAYLMAFTKMQKAMFVHLQAEYGWVLHERHQKHLPDLLERLNAIARTGPKELPALEENLGKKQNLVAEELARLDKELNRGIEKNQQVMAAIREIHRRLSAELSRPVTESGESVPTDVLAAIEERLGAAENDLREITQSAAQSHDTVDALRGLYHKKCEATLAVYAVRNELAIVEQLKGTSRLQRMMGARITEPVLPVAGLDKREDPAPLAQEREQLMGQWEEAGKRLLDFEERHRKLSEIRDTLQGFYDFQQVYGTFRRAVRRKMAGQRAMAAITGRISQLEREAENMDTFIRDHMLPAQAAFARRVHLPGARKRLEYFQRTKMFVQELNEIRFDQLQREFLDRAIFRRFYAAQFRKGAHFGLNPDLPVFAKLSNLLQGMFLFHRQLQQALTKSGLEPGQITFTKMPTERVPAIIQFIEEQKELRADHRFTYLVLPGTLSLTQALEIIQHKDEVFDGMPQLALVFISKFDTSGLLEDEELRERFFNAVKHNVIINIDEEQMVDNPKSIADRMLQETLGCAHDFKVAEPGGELAPTVQSSTG